MTGEPFHLTLDYIARLTRWQIEHLYLRPARRRARAMEERAEAREAPRRSKAKAAPVPQVNTRAEFIASWSATGGTLAHWNAIADKMVARGELTEG